MKKLTFQALALHQSEWFALMKVKVKVKSAYEPNWLIRLELIPVSVALSD